MTSRSSLLVDVGATYIKVAVLRDDENIVAENKFDFPPFSSLDGPYRTVDPTVTLAAVEAAIASVLPGADNPERILLSGQMHGWTLTDEHNVPQLPLATFQDNRALSPRNGSSYLDELRNAQPSETWLAAGNELRSGLPVAGIYATDLTAFDGPLRVHSLLSWVAAALTGAPAFVQHLTDAAASGMFDLKAGSWSEPIAALVGGRTRLRLPRVSSALEVVGIHPASGAAVFTPVGDQQAALLGAGLRHGVTAFNISTGGQVARLADTHAEDRCQTRHISTDCCCTPGRTCRPDAHSRTALSCSHAVTPTTAHGSGPCAPPPRPRIVRSPTRTRRSTTLTAVGGHRSRMRTPPKTCYARSLSRSPRPTSTRHRKSDTSRRMNCCSAVAWPSVSPRCAPLSSRAWAGPRRWHPTEIWRCAGSPW
ncbi:FGGY family carbohydrate kinase [Mycobacterium stomatepiae]|uniref:Carbohydrate kinase FGGY N-terminal domain-containing protein n=1 Tax=Mycobacterium stomatepiae TaxID=470076 RepID=A0A7I7Q4C6_9MYCO|nr:FGGY family carbohydrate kinase [Mycobacterium stomatepiae]BBY20991.1 hypothetical protein MSTO_11960 [Mycobacterium stomatepiae]